MGQAGGVLQRIGYTKARWFLLLIGLVGLGAIAAVTYLRGVRGPEALVTPLFIPIFVAFLAWGLRGGLIAGIGAALVYVGLRYSAIQTVGFEQLGGTILLRVGAFVAFGLLGGWASKQLESSLTKLDLYDQIDDDTGLYNSRFFLQDTDLEMTRSKRYQTIFSIAVIDIPAQVFGAFSRRQRAGALRELGRMLRDSVRTVDRAVHSRGRDSHRLAVVLPETGRQGARIFTDRFAERVAEYFRRRGAPAPGQLERAALTYPEDEEAINRLRSEFEVIERAEHPEEVESSRAQPAAE